MALSFLHSWIFCTAMQLLLATANDGAPTGFDLEILQPAFSGASFIQTESAHLQPPMSLYVGSALVYVYQPLNLEIETAGQSSSGSLVDHRLDLQLWFNIALSKQLELGFGFPLTISECASLSNGQTISYPGSNLDGHHLNLFALGNFRFFGKLQLWQGWYQRLAFALLSPMVFPALQAETGFAAEKGFVWLPTLAFSALLGPVDVAVDLGIRYRQKHSIVTAQRFSSSQITQQNNQENSQIIMDVGSEWLFKSAVAWRFWAFRNNKLQAILEVYGYTPLFHPFSGFYGSNNSAKAYAAVLSPVEIIGGFRAKWGDCLLTAGLGLGLSSGYGAGLPHAFLGGSWYTEKSLLKDSDGDGIADRDDKCPYQPEDKDGFEDNDGCPDFDNDEDGVLDDDDQCPFDPEDNDGFEDNDGCPDPDNDADGIADTKDLCPNQAEDKDGIKDEDGCPESDADGDGIDDAVDLCPLEAEDKDGFEDEDGCPDPDNDADGIADEKDLCPLYPEDKDGFEDSDGCPEDNDNDGIADLQDRCPNAPETYNGLDDTDGCPEKTPPIVWTLTQDDIRLHKTIHFIGPHHDALSVASQKIFDVLVTLLNNAPHLKKLQIDVQIKTPLQKNAVLQRLALARAVAIQKYLIEHGIHASRLQAIGGTEKILATPLQLKIFIIESTPPAEAVTPQRHLKNQGQPSTAAASQSSQDPNAPEIMFFLEQPNSLSPSPQPPSAQPPNTQPPRFAPKKTLLHKKKAHRKKQEIKFDF